MTTLGTKTRALMDSLRRTKKRLRLSADGLRDELNQRYLKRDERVSLGTVNRWLQRAGAPSSEYLIALQNFIHDNQTKKR